MFACQSSWEYWFEGLGTQAVDSGRRLDLRHQQQRRFSRASDKPGSTGQYAAVRLHAGLVCIDAPFSLNLQLQRQLFALVLDDLTRNGDLTNQLLEINVDKSGRVEIRRIAFPQDEVD